MEKSVLFEIKDSVKVINSLNISFKKLKRNSLPAPYKRLGGPRAYCSGLMEVSNDLHVLFVWRDGDILTDTGFYGYLAKKLNAGFLSIFEFHWHPSHKGYHCIVPCDVDNHMANRFIPRNAPELKLIHPNNTNPSLDPRKEEDRLNLINFFCERVNIQALSSNINSQTEIPLQ